MNGLGLSPAEIEARRCYVQAGDAAAIMAGDWRPIWHIKRGSDTEQDLSGVLAVQLGSMTEPFNLAWCQERTGRHIDYYSANPLMRAIWLGLTNEPTYVTELQVSPTFPWMACNLDGLTTTPQGHPCVIDAKHVGKLDEQTMLRYTAGMVHQATVMGTDWWALSCLIGNGKHEVIYQEVDPIYQATLIAKEREFWGYVERGQEPPTEEKPILAPKPQPKLRTIIVPTEADEVFEALVRQNNWLPEWCRLARTFVETHGAATKHAITREEMKALVPEDIGIVQRGGVKQARDRAGAVRMSLAKMEDE